jgi:hypothetical protein
MSDKCEICRDPAALTASGVLYRLTVSGPQREYTHWICGDCVRLFNTTRWAAARVALQQICKLTPYYLRAWLQ